MQCPGEARSGAAVVRHRIVVCATRRGRSAARDATTPRVYECVRDASTSRQPESSSNCASSAAGGTTSRRRRTARVVHALYRRDQTEKRVSESNAKDPRGGCVRTRLRPDCAALTERIVSKNHVLSEIDSTLSRKCKSEGVERLFAVVNTQNCVFSRSERSVTRSAYVCSGRSRSARVEHSLTGGESTDGADID